MRRKILIAIFSILIALGQDYDAQAQERRNTPREPLEANPLNALRHKELSKKVYESKLITDMEDAGGWSVRGIAGIGFTGERFIDGKTSLRFKTKKVDMGLIRKSVLENGSFTGAGGGSTSAVYTFPEPQDWSDYNRIAVWVYVHPAKQGYTTFYIGFGTADTKDKPLDPHYITAIHTLRPGQWNYVTWEIANLPRENVKEFYVYQRLRGSDPEVEDEIIYDVDHAELQKVDAEKYEGWDVVSGGIAFSHTGYRPGQPKVALGTDLSSPEFQVVDAHSQEVMVSKPLRIEVTKRGRFQVLDFSELQKQGRYYIRAGEFKSRSFLVADTLWRGPLNKILNFYYCERCGYDVPGIHHVCHRDWQGIHEGEKKIINGGWHDAGDLSQGSFRTGMSIYAMFDIYRQMEIRDADPELRRRLLDEALWGLDWLLKTRFGNGYRITWSTQRIYSDCVIGTMDDVITPAENDPWENFLAAAVEAYAYEIGRDRMPGLAKESLKAAEEDWEAAALRQDEWLKSGNSAQALTPLMANVYLTSSWGIVSSLRLFRLSGDQKYQDKAIEYANILLSCQEQSFRDGIPITGYFYDGPEKRTILHHQHAAFEESPLIALAELCGAFPGHPDWIKWYAALTLHAEYFLKRGAAYSDPFSMLPNSVYRRSELEGITDPEIKEQVMRQFNEGTVLSNEYSLRMFPIWHTTGFHGNTAVQLSEALALEAAVLARNDLDGEALVERQMQWLVGLNPFSQSLIYGEGYDFKSLYAPSSGDLVGAVPVGMDCMSGDAPYWYDSNYPTYKEVWVVPASRFLWNAAFIGMPAHLTGKVQGGGVNIIQLYNRSTGKSSSIPVRPDGSFSEQAEAGDYTLECGSAKREMTMVSGGSYEIVLNPQSYIVLRAEGEEKQNGTVRIVISARGEGRHKLEFRTFNATIDRNMAEIELNGPTSTEIVQEAGIIDRNKPWVAVIVPDGDLSGKVELTGASGNNVK